MHSTSNLIFDITTGTFFRYSSAHPGADEFTNLGLAAQTSFTFKLGFEVVQRGSKDQASILLAALNGVDLSAVGTMGDSAVIGTTTQGADITLTLGHDGAYTLAASSGTLDGLDALDVAVRPFSSTFDRTVDGDRDGYEVIYAQSSQANMFNDSTPVEITSVRLSSGDTLYSDGVALQVDAGWVPVSGNVGEIRLVQDGDAQVLEYRDERANSAFQQIVDLTIENGAGETRDLDPIFLFNLGESSAPAPLTTVDVSGTAFPAMMPDLVRLMPLSGQDNVDQDGDGTLDGLTITPTHTAISDGDWNDPHTWASDTVPGDGAIVHIPMGLSVDASGAISDGAHVFMVRVDGTLSVDAPAGTDTTLLVDTIFATHMGTLNIDAADATAGTIDIVIQGYDLDTPPPNWDAATQAYYGPDQDVSGIGANTAVVDDGTGVLGRFAWDPEQVSLGIVSMGTANVAGQDKTAHIEHAGLAAGADSLVVDSALGWGVGDRLLVAGTQYGGDTALTAGLPAGTDSNDDLYAKAGQDEVVRIQSVSDLGNGQVALTFDTALVFDHMPPTFANSDAPDLSVNIANLSRNVTIRSGAATDAADGDIADASSIDRSDPVGQGDDLPDVPLGIGHLIGEPADSPDHHYVTERGHIMFMHTDDVSVANVAFRGLGRTDKTATLDHIAGTLTEDSSSQTNGDVVRDTSGLSAFADPGAITNMTGRYAVHLHQAGTAAGDGDTGALIIGNVVENAVGWGFAQHGSEAILANNVSYDVVGAGFMAETGDETGVWYNNLSVRNTGFMSDQNDPQSQAKTNDIGRNGDAFWTEGRAIAIINNTAVSSKTGFSVQPFGVKQVELETAALSDYQVYFDVVNATFGLTGAAALTVNPDEQNAELALLAHGTDTILQNGFMPIRYFKGNTVLDADTGLSLLTSNEHASRKLNDAWSILSDFTAVHVDKGVFVQYASKYVFEDFNILGLNRPNSNAIELSTSTNEVTAVNWHIEGYLGDAVDQTLRVGIRHANFADHWGPADFTDAFKDQNSSVNGYGPTLAMWDGFAEPINPFLNFYSNSFLDVRVQRAWDDDAFAITAADFTQQRALRVELDYMPEGYNQQTGDFTLIAEDAPAVSDTGVDVDLIFSSKTIGMVAEWREQYNDRGHYAQNFAIDNGDGTYDFEVPLFYFNDEYGERRSGAGPSGYQYNTGPDDVWSGVLVEFDKFDSLGARRYAYDIEAVLDENADQAFEINTGTVVDEDTGETITLESTGNALYRERVTTNERLVFTKDQINATLENNGYSVMDGMTFTDANGTVQDMRFVVIATPLSDRLTGTLEVFRFVVALDENWGADGSIDMDSITNTGQLDRLQDNIVLSDAYGHFRDGVLIGTPVALADSTLADGIVTGGSGNDDITASFVDDPGGDMQTSASDLIYGRGGDDTSEATGAVTPFMAVMATTGSIRAATATWSLAGTAMM